MIVNNDHFEISSKGLYVPSSSLLMCSGFILLKYFAIGGLPTILLSLKVREIKV